MTTVNIDFADREVSTTQRSSFEEAKLPAGTDKIQIDVKSGGFRLAGIAFGDNFDDDGSPFAAINGYVPWKAGGVWQPIQTITAVTINNNQCAGIPYAEVCMFDDIELVLTTPLSVETKIGIFGWTG